MFNIIMKTSKFISALAMATALSFSAVAGNNTTHSEQSPDPIQEMKAAQEKAKKDFENFKNKTNDDFNTHKEDVIARYIAYRDSVLSEFVKHMKLPWTKTEVKPAIPKPKDRSVGPEITPLEKKSAPQEEILVDNTPIVEPKAEPKPLVEEPKIEPKAEPKIEPKEEPKEDSKKGQKRSTKEDTTPTVREEPKVQPQEEVKPTVNEEPKAEPKEEPKAQPKKEEQKPVVKEEKKVVVKETPKVSPSTPKPKIIPVPTPVIIKDEPKEENKPVAEEPKEEPKPIVEEPKAEPKPKKEGPKATPLGGNINELEVKDVVDLSNIDFNIQPVPFVPVVVPTDNEPDIFDFEFFGTPVSVRIDESCRFTLSGVNSKAIASAMEEITKNELLNVTLGDCLDVRDDMKLCDWAYLELLTTLTASFFEQECNEATLLAGYLYCMSGYQMRFAFSKTNVEILFTSDQDIYDLKPTNLYVNGYQTFFCLNPNVNYNELQLCNYAFPNEKCMSLFVSELPEFEQDIEEKNLKLNSYRMNLDYSLILNFTLNKNLIDFFNTYPTPATKGDMYSRWIYYAKTPLSDTAKEKLYPTLRQAIEGKTELKAVNIILNWIHTYKYGYDDKVWGYDRAFFPDESLFYPYTDCEDRAILFSRIVSDLLGLKVALIYYPGHLAAAVKFNGDVQGDYIMHNGEKFTVCDPTIESDRDNVGRTMSSVKNTQATLILL